jgi:hypothetical protein
LIAYKLLREGRTGPFSGAVWPPVGEWFEPEALDRCRSGVHACPVDTLPLWVGLGELWEVELDGVVAEERKLVARRGRLVRRIDAWDDAARLAYVEACAEQTRRLVASAPALAAFADDIDPSDDAGVAGYVAARVAELHDGPDGYDAERRRQAEWLSTRLDLSGSPA